MNLAAIQLTKLTIDAYQDVKFEQRAGLSWQALLNPTELSFTRKNQYQPTQAAGASAPEQAYTGGEPDQVSLDLLLDGTGVVADASTVAEKVDGLFKLTNYNGDVHQPYYVHAHWGRFSFRGILTQVDLAYKLFDRSGEPLRVAVKLAIKGAMSREERIAIDKPSSPNLYQTWLVKDGERLDAIAGQVYGDPAYWRSLARANQLANPRSLTTGQVLLLPPLAVRT